MDTAKKTPSGANSPYKIQKRGKKWAVVNNAGETKATFDSHEKALGYLRALYVNVPGAQKRAEKVKFTGKAKNRVPVQKSAEEARNVSTQERKKLAKQGKANPDGGFPVKTVQDVKNAIQSIGRAKNPARTKALIIRACRRLGVMNLVPDSWMKKMPGKKMSDKASLEIAMITCPHDECDRAFLTEDGLFDHAESVHTFNDIQRAVSDAVREKYRVEGDPRVGIQSVWAWVEDLTDEWVVFQLENGGNCSLQQAPYTMDDSGEVTIGDPVEVQRRTVYEAVKVSS